MIIRYSALAVAISLASVSAPAAWAGSSNTAAKPGKGQQTASQASKQQDKQGHQDGMLRDKHKTFKGKFKQHHGFGGQLHADR